MNWENKQEGWVKFRRVYCVEDYIDVWTGDSFHNPNNKTQPSIQLNF